MNAWTEEMHKKHKFTKEEMKMEINEKNYIQFH